MENDTAPAWDGVPLNPERDGTHLIITSSGVPYGLRWSALRGVWDAPWGRSCLPAELAESGNTYEGPCLTPAEVAAREAAAYAAGAEAMREMALDAADAVNTDHCSEEEEDAANTAIGDAITAIRSLPLPPLPGQPQGGVENDAF